MNSVRSSRLLPLVGAALLLIPGLQAQDKSRGRKYTPPPPTCKVTVRVVRSYNGKPVEDAAVVFHDIKDGKDQGNMELKTNEEGKATLDVIPVGDTVRLQVVAGGFQTFGEDYALPGESREITVKLNRPGHQYSLYEAHPGQSGSGSQDGGGKPQNSQKPPQ